MCLHTLKKILLRGVARKVFRMELIFLECLTVLMVMDSEMLFWGRLIINQTTKDTVGKYVTELFIILLWSQFRMTRIM